MSVAVAVESEKLESGCCPCCICETEACVDDLGVQDKFHLRFMAALGSLTILVSIAQFAVGGFIFNHFESKRRGSWWTGVLTLFAGYASVMIRKKGWITATCIISTFAIIAAGVGTVIDAIFYKLLNRLEACASLNEATKTVSTYGRMDLQSSADSCLESLQIENENMINNCACVSTPDDCYSFKLTSSVMEADGCRGILTTMPRIVLTSTALCASVALLAFALAIGSCVIICCPPKKDYDSEVQTAEFVLREPPLSAVVIVDDNVTITRGAESSF